MASLLAATPNPPRELISLAERLKLHSSVPAGLLVGSAPTNYPLGRIDRFYILNGSNEVLVPARLDYRTAHAYFYVQTGIKIDMRALIASATVFEQKIYPTDVAAFGSPSPPGAASAQRVTIFSGLLQGSGAAGYVSSEDLFPRSIDPFSNERAILYLDLGSEDPGSAEFNSVLAHEFQHVIHAFRHPTDEAWLNEGSSVLAQVLNGYSAGGWDEQKAQQPGAQLDVWDPVSDIGYGNGYMWMLYLYEHFGGDRATRLEVSDNGLSGLALFNDLLPRLGAHETANQLFGDWIVANFLNDRSLAGGRYGYSHTDVHATATSTQTVPFSITSTMQQYAANYVDIPSTGGKLVTITFSGQPTVPLLTTVPPSPLFWWSNRGDSVDDTLTLPPLDLRRAPHATLRYKVWYDLERDYDYGYVEVSTDAGKTWYAQKTPHTTSTNPNGTSMATGYTGSSCAAAAKGAHCWLDERIDLSAYAGKQILVRFEQVTDDEVNLQGIALSDIQVPQIGFDEDSSPTGWHAAGWVRAITTLAEQWTVQAICYRPGGITVVPFAIGGDGHGTLVVPAGTSRVVVVVSPMAPLTTVSSSYSLRASWK